MTWKIRKGNGTIHCSYDRPGRGGYINLGKDGISVCLEDNDYSEKETLAQKVSFALNSNVLLKKNGIRHMELSMMWGYHNNLLTISIDKPCLAILLLVKTIKETLPSLKIDEIERDIYQSVFNFETIKAMNVDEAIELALAVPVYKDSNFSKDLLEYYMEGLRQNKNLASVHQILRLAENIPSENPYFYNACQTSIDLRSELMASIKLSQEKASESKAEATSPRMFKKAPADASSTPQAASVDSTYS